MGLAPLTAACACAEARCARGDATRRHGRHIGSLRRESTDRSIPARRLAGLNDQRWGWLRSLRPAPAPRLAALAGTPPGATAATLVRSAARALIVPSRLAGSPG